MVANKRWVVTAVDSQQPLDRFVRSQITGLSWNAARKLIQTGKISINGHVTAQATHLVTVGDTVELDAIRPNRQSTPVAGVPIVHIDSQIVVVDKPAGISTVPYDDQERDTLLSRVQLSLGKRFGAHQTLHVVHRIDKETSGLVVFARTNVALKNLKQLFRVHDIERQYWALVDGKMSNQTIRSRLIADRGDGRRGSTQSRMLGREAITHVRVIENFRNATLIECQLETGRTHQIRIHLSEAGHPLLGERVYRVGEPRFAAERLMLHARVLGIQHPQTFIRHRWTSEPPTDMVETINKLRQA